MRHGSRARSGDASADYIIGIIGPHRSRGSQPGLRVARATHGVYSHGVNPSPGWHHRPGATPLSQGVPGMDSTRNGDSMLHAANDYLLRVSELLGLEYPIYERLSKPRRVLVVSVPTRMDDGAIEVFTGYRVHHNISRGPAKGGLRYHPGATLEEDDRAGGADDVEVRRGQHPLRRRQGRGGVQSAYPFDWRAGAPDSPLHLRDPSHPGAGEGHPRA